MNLSYLHSVASLCLVALLHDVLHEHDHLFFLDLSIAVLVHGGKSLLEFRLVVVVGRWDALHDGSEEILGFGLVKSACFVGIKLLPNPIDSIPVNAVLLNLSSHPVREGPVVGEDRVVDQHFDVLREALPNDRLLVAKSLTVNEDDLLILRWLSSCRRLTLTIFGGLTIVRNL